jgi:adenylate kinase
MNIIFFGAPGAGKGTQSKTLADRLGLAHISTGEIFRRHKQEGTELGRKAQSYMDAGLLVPDEVTTAIALDAIDRDDAAAGWILDGFPRNIDQAQALQAALVERGKKIDRVIYLTATAEELVQRMLLRGRVDDTLEVIQTRLDVYAQETAPVLGFYRDMGLVSEVDGMGEIQEVHDRILGTLGVTQAPAVEE